MIDPNIWQSEDFSKLSVLARLVFIGLFSNADDEGRGRAKAVYIKSILFPYDECLRVADVEEALHEIAAHLSILFYTVAGNEYYSLTHWNGWQRVDKPQPSKIPRVDENAKMIRGCVWEPSANDGGTGLPNRKEEKQIEQRKKQNGEEFCPPAVEEVEAYCRERANGVDAQAFVDFYESKGWMIGKNKMRDWRASVRSWEKNKQGSAQSTVEQRAYSPAEHQERKRRAMEELMKDYGVKSGNAEREDADNGK